MTIGAKENSETIGKKKERPPELLGE